MKPDKKNFVILALSIIVICTLIFSAYSYLQFQSYLQEQELQEDLQVAYAGGVQDGILSTLNNILSQLNSNGYVILNIDTGNSCDNLSCIENSGGNCLVYSIWHKGKPKPDITVCENYEVPKLINKGLGDKVLSHYRVMEVLNESL